MAVCTANYPNSDDDFVTEVRDGRITPTRVSLSDEQNGAQRIDVEFPSHFACQIHMHVQWDGEIIGHIKGNNGDRHNIYQVHLQLILDRLQLAHGAGRFDMTYR